MPLTMLVCSCSLIARHRLRIIQQKRPRPFTVPGRIRDVQDAYLSVTDLVGSKRGALPSST